VFTLFIIKEIIECPIKQISGNNNKTFGGLLP
jgi:hypothetical protein